MMHRFLFVSLLCVAMVLPAHSDPLWRSAVEIFEQNRDVYASRMRTEFSEYDGRGNRRNHREVELSLSPAPDGSMVTSLVWARENGVDLDPADATLNADPVFSAEAQATGSESRAASMAVIENSPFDPKLQANLEYMRIGPASPSSEAGGIEFGYTLTTETGTIEGRTWLDPVTGTPLRLRATVTPMPKFVREMTVDQRFASGPAGWFTEEVDVVADGGFLFIRRTVRVNLRFLDHRRPPGSPQRSTP